MTPSGGYSSPLIQLQRPTIATDRARRISTRRVNITIDGQAVTVREGTTILGACGEIGIGIPTLCFLETLHPVNACRICVVELEGARVLVPACSRTVDEGMVIQTNSPRVQHSRKLVLELLASSVDLSTTSQVAEWLAEYGAKPERFGPPAPPTPPGTRDASIPGHHAPPDPEHAATVAEPTKIDNDLYVRDYAKCILCYKCVEACGPDHQNTFAIAVAGRGFDAHISTEFAVPLPESACVYCGNCIAVCPTGALMAKREFDMRAEGTYDESRQTTTDTICPYCGVGCTLTLHVQDEQIVKAMSPLENSITQGNLCIKGRFGWRFVQNRGEAVPPETVSGNGRH
jgi:predicted molibdopterin-dependent oxidoreductase YjgC